MGSVETLTRTQLASPFRTALIDLCFEARLRRRRHRGPLQPRRSRSCHLRGPLRRPRGLLLSDLPQRARALPSPGRSRSHRARRLAGPPARHAYALYRYLDEDERLRRFTVVEARVAGERPALLIGEEIEELSDLIDEGRAEPTARPTLTRATAESLGGGIFSQIYLAAGHAGPMPREEEEVPQMMYSAVLPYLGAARAAEELEIPPPPRPAGS